MPNTLAHFGIQVPATRFVFRKADAKWLLLGCIIPDCPWILRRLVRALHTEIDLYDLQLYAIVQSSLVFCVLLGAAIATVAERRAQVFGILSLNSLLHLSLDACQIKWGNGVHLFAPFSWKLQRFGLFWPDSLPTRVLTVAGLVVFVWFLRDAIRRPPEWARAPSRWLLALLLLVIYMLLPPAFMSAAEQADNHAVKTLRNVESRTGQTIALDRCRYFETDGRAWLRTYARERLELVGIRLGHPALISVRAVFLDQNTLEVRQYHEHSRWFRDVASYVGLGLLGAVWAVSFLPRRRSRVDRRPRVT